MVRMYNKHMSELAFELHETEQLKMRNGWTLYSVDHTISRHQSFKCRWATRNIDKRIKGWQVLFDSQHGIYNRKVMMYNRYGFVTMVLRHKSGQEYRWTRCVNHWEHRDQITNSIRYTLREPVLHSDLNLAVKICDPEIHTLVTFKTYNHIAYNVLNENHSVWLGGRNNYVSDINDAYGAALKYVTTDWDKALEIAEKLQYRGKLRVGKPDLSEYHQELQHLIYNMFLTHYGRSKWHDYRNVRPWPESLSPSFVMMMRGFREVVWRVQIILARKGIVPISV